MDRAGNFGLEATKVGDPKRESCEEQFEEKAQNNDTLPREVDFHFTNQCEFDEQPEEMGILGEKIPQGCPGLDGTTIDRGWIEVVQATTALRLKNERKDSRPAMPMPRSAIEAGSGTARAVVEMMTRGALSGLPVVYVQSALSNVMAAVVVSKVNETLPKGLGSWGLEKLTSTPEPAEITAVLVVLFELVKITLTLEIDPPVPVKNASKSAAALPELLIAETVVI